MKLWHAITTAALIWAAVFLSGLGTQELKGEEGRRVLPGRNMLMHGDWAVPHVGGKVYQRKPPLMNWLAAASFRSTGVQNEWTARLPSALSVLALAVTLVLANAGWMRGAGIAFMAAVFAMTNLAMLEKGRLAELEPLYVALTGMAFALWSGFFMGGRSPWLTWTIPGLILGLGVLAKGPLHLLFFYGPVIGVLVVGKRWRDLLSLPHGAGIVAMLLPVLPWALMSRARAAELEPGGKEAGGVWIEQLTSRLTFEGVSVVEWFLTPFEALLNYFPWVILLGVLWWRIAQWKWNVSPTLELQLERTTRRQWMRGAAWGVGISFGLVALLPGCSARYLHPAIGPASMLLAVMVSQLAPGHAIYDRVSVVWRGTNRVVLVLSGVVLLLVPPVTLLWGNWMFPVVWFAVGCLVCGLAVFVGWRLARHESLVYQTGASACVMAAAMQLYSVAVLPAMVPEDNVRPVGLEFAEALPDGARLCVYKPGFQAFLFYLDPPYAVEAKVGEIPEETTHLLMPERRLEEGKVVALLEDGEYSEVLRVPDKDGKPWLLFARPAEEEPPVPVDAEEAEAEASQ